MSEERLLRVIFCALVLTLLALWYVRNERMLVVHGNPENLISETREKILGGDQAVKIHFLDIGQGDATLIDFANGEQMLVDCSKDARILTALGRNMKPFDRTIDYLVVTHPDNDHYGGCIDVLDRFTVKHIWYNGVRKTSDSYWNFFWDKMHAEGAEYWQVNTATTRIVASTTIRMLYPDHDVASSPRVPGSTKDTGDNNTSIIFRLENGYSTVLMTGDMEIPLENYLLKVASSSVRANILKVGHHGSNSSSEQPFLDVVQPQVATISVGKDNSYGHPTLRVLRRLERIGATILRTDLIGDITYSLTTSGVSRQ